MFICTFLLFIDKEKYYLNINKEKSKSAYLKFFKSLNYWLKPWASIEYESRLITQTETLYIH